MGELANTVMAVMALSAPFDIPPEPHSENWCTPGYVVMLPEGREGMVTSIDGDICRVVADGEKYVTLIPHFIVEPVYPQPFARRAYR
jgi:hypothetical protein